MSGLRLLRQFEDPANAHVLGYRGTADPGCARFFPGDTQPARLARALCERSALPFKELLESYEFYASVRKHVRAAHLADLCAGHGLVGVLFALCERSVERVHLLERRRPPNRERVLAAAAAVGPWVRDKLVEQHVDLRQARPALPRGCAVVAVHACGTLTDAALELALETGGPLALLPCCRSHRQSPAPAVLARALGPDLAYDVDRTYRLERAGFHVRWHELAEVITPMNRVIVARPRKPRASRPRPSAAQDALAPR
ncbi:MAG: hypothetical protein H6828_14385 [Planctomycetes bacterium]|nr:hypothetical protein [Planctomycetota bacterium]